MQAVSYLNTLAGVDRTRIATVGYSMGTFITGITGAIGFPHSRRAPERRGHLRWRPPNFSSGKLPCQAPPWRSLGVLGDRGAMPLCTQCSPRPNVGHEWRRGFGDAYVGSPTRFGSRASGRVQQGYAERTTDCSQQCSIRASATALAGLMWMACCGSTGGSAAHFGAMRRFVLGEQLIFHSGFGQSWTSHQTISEKTAKVDSTRSVRAFLRSPEIS